VSRVPTLSTVIIVMPPSPSPRRKLAQAARMRYNDKTDDGQSDPERKWHDGDNEDSSILFSTLQPNCLVKQDCTPCVTLSLKYKRAVCLPYRTIRNTHELGKTHFIHNSNTTKEVVGYYASVGQTSLNPCVLVFLLPSHRLLCMLDNPLPW
jgi:hypothetical protein